MINFVDLKTGNIFNGDKPYIFWVDGEQSINMIYTKSICFISDKSNINVRINNNDIFNLIDPVNFNEKFIKYDDLPYYELKNIFTNNINLKGYPYNGFYIYMIYISCSTQSPGEYVENFYLDEYEYNIGADFYGEEESLYINLSNIGTEIPETIQKAIYPSNIREDKRDNILLNRKFKELLSNYWDIVNNQGSYKSLFKSLKWFEYGDLVKLRELWKTTDHNETRYEIRDIQQVFERKYFETFANYNKTTYIALYLALNEICKSNDTILYDKEKNPILKDIVFDWSVNDLSLKMCLLGYFYKQYFMPIHLDLIHSTIEKIVYTSNFKTKIDAISHRNDFIYNTKDCKCNIKDGDIFNLGIVEAYVYKDTLFGVQYGSQKTMDDFKIIGVDRVAKNNQTPISIQDIITLSSQFYKESGVILDFQINVPLKSNEYIKTETLIIEYNLGEKIDKRFITDYKLIKNNTFDFHILCQFAGDYKISLYLDTTLGNIYTKTVNCKVQDSNGAQILLYKIINNDYSNVSNINRKTINDYVFNHYTTLDILSNYDKYDKFKHIRFIPTSIKSWDNGELNKGVCLNHLLVFKSDISDDLSSYLNKYYTFHKKELKEFDEFNCFCDTQLDTTINYNIYISNSFGFKPDSRFLKEIEDKSYINRYIFCPELHSLKLLNNSSNIEDYIIYDGDALCVSSSILHGGIIEESTWVLKNSSTGQEISHSVSSEPFLSWDSQTYLPNGFYDIIFNYKLKGNDDVYKISLNSAFIKK